MAEVPQMVTRSVRRAHATASGALLALAPVPFSVLPQGARPLGAGPWWLLATAGLVSALLVLASGAILWRSRTGAVLATLGVVGTLGLAGPRLSTSPLATLGTLVVFTLALLVLWRASSPERGRREPTRPLDEGQTQGAALVTLALWLLGALNGTDTLFLNISLGIAVLLTADWAVRHLRDDRGRALVLLLTTAFALIAPMTWGEATWLVACSLNAAAAASLLVHQPGSMTLESTPWWELFLGHPERLLVGTFGLLCAGGAVVLALPHSASTGVSVGLIDAGFTAASAVCVTGLAVLDTPVAFSRFGQVVIVVLIQLGGLGIMTFSTAALFALGRRLSLRHEGAMASLMSPQDRGQLVLATQRILKFTFVVESLGTVLLCLTFMARGEAFGPALWRGAFTAISAFCNAGFALQSDSLVSYQDSPTVLLTVALLIVLGSMAPAATLSVITLVRRPTQPVSAQAKLSLVTTVGLVVLGWVLIGAFEWNASLDGLPAGARVLNALFQSVTLRTAGFNSVDLTLVQPATITLMLVWMFIGGGPGGTAGGVKTTTIAVLLLSVAQVMRGRSAIEIFGRRIPESTQQKAAAIVTIAATGGVVALLSLELTQSIPGRVLVFEVVSALATVGLSLGGTTQLDGVGKAIIVLCMFIGRVGGLTLLMFLGRRFAAPTPRRPEEAIDVG